MIIPFITFPTLHKSHFMGYNYRTRRGTNMTSKEYKVRPDSKGRITLGKIAEGVSSYTVIREKDRIILEPNIEIPAKEKWLFDNKKALRQVKKGLEDSASGNVKSRGNFAKYVDDKE